MKKKKEFKYHLKDDVRDDLVNLVDRINFLLVRDLGDGFKFIQPYSILPSLFMVFSHLLWDRTFETWFKKVYE